MNQENREEIEIDLQEIFYLLVSRIPVILLTMLLFGAVTGMWNKLLIEPTYTSTSKLYILTKSTSITSVADVQLNNYLTKDYMELIKSRPVVEQVIDNLKLDMTYEQVLTKVKIVNPSDTRILNITVSDHSPQLAKEMTNEFAMVSKKRISEIMDTEEPNIVEEGVVSEYPVSPETKKNVLIAVMLGFILSCGVIIVMYLMDDSIKTEEDVEKYLGLNTLAMIPVAKSEQDEIEQKKQKKWFHKSKKGA